MSDIKFLTVFDDEKGHILNGPYMYGYKLAYLPVFYKYNDESYIDGVNIHHLVNFLMFNLMLNLSALIPESFSMYMN